MRGFSLLELFITIAIIGVLAALAGPSITTMIQNRTASIEVDKVQAAFEAARDDARARLRCIRVRNTTASTLTIEELTPVGTACGTVVAGTPEVKQFNARAVAMPGTIDITFTRTGSVSGTVDPTFVVQALRPGHAPRPHSFKIFRALGLVRRLS